MFILFFCPSPVDPFYPFKRRSLTTDFAEQIGITPVLPFQKKVINNKRTEIWWCYLPVLPFQKKAINNHWKAILSIPPPVLPFQKKVINNLGKITTEKFYPVLPFQKKAINNPFSVKPYNKGIYNRKVSEIFHNFTVSLLPNTLLFMFHSHYFIKYSKN